MKNKDRNVGVINKAPVFWSYSRKGWLVICKLIKCFIVKWGNFWGSFSHSLFHTTKSTEEDWRYCKCRPTTITVHVEVFSINVVCKVGYTVPDERSPLWEKPGDIFGLAIQFAFSSHDLHTLMLYLCSLSTLWQYLLLMTIYLLLLWS